MPKQQFLILKTEGTQHRSVSHCWPRPLPPPLCRVCQGHGSLHNQTPSTVTQPLRPRAPENRKSMPGVRWPPGGAPLSLLLPAQSGCQPTAPLIQRRLRKDLLLAPRFSQIAGLLAAGFLDPVCTARSGSCRAQSGNTG